MDGAILLSSQRLSGGQRKSTPAELMAKDPERFIKRVIKGMLPKNRLGAKILGNLYVFAGPEHDKQAQKPKKSI